MEPCARTFRVLSSSSCTNKISSKFHIDAFSFSFARQQDSSTFWHRMQPIVPTFRVDLKEEKRHVQLVFDVTRRKI